MLAQVFSTGVCKYRGTGHAEEGLLSKKHVREINHLLGRERGVGKLGQVGQVLDRIKNSVNRYSNAKVHAIYTLFLGLDELRGEATMTSK
jgi:hypothetical protein